MNDSIEFTAVWEPDDQSWQIYLDGELLYEGITSEEISGFASDLVASNSQ